MHSADMARVRHQWEGEIEHGQSSPVDVFGVREDDGVEDLDDN
jgi:hypothetical protein